MQQAKGLGRSLDSGFKRATIEESLPQKGMMMRKKPQSPTAANTPAPAALLERAADFYHDELLDSPGIKFLQKNHLADSDLLGNFRIGWCGGHLGQTLPPPAEDGPHEALKQASVLLSDGTERFLDCLTFPLFDSEGSITALCGARIPNGQIVIPEDLPIHLWNAPALAIHPEILMAGTPLDAFALQTAGFPNACGLVGHPGENDTRLLAELGVVRIVLVGGCADIRFDGIECLRISLPGSKSPRQVLSTGGTEALTADVDKAPRNSAASGNNQVLSTASGFTACFNGRHYELMGVDRSTRRLKATVRAERAGRIHVDTVDFYSARSRRSLCQDLCQLYEETPAVIEADVSRLMHACENRPKANATRLAPVMSSYEREEARAFGSNPNLLDRIVEDYNALGLVGEPANKMLCYLAAVSRLMPEPLSVMILSSSGSGKTALQDATLKFCPPEDVVKVTSLTGKALFYKERNALKHKVLALEEGEGATQASYAIRNLISSGELVIESAVKDLGSGRMTTMQNRVEGPTTVFITTTDPETDPETRSRFFVTSIDESRAQTRAILEFQRRNQAMDQEIRNAKREDTLRVHRNFQRLLNPVAVINPFADQLTYGDDRLQGRRDQPKYLNLIKAVAFIRQMQPPPAKGTGAPGKRIKGTSKDGKKLPYVEVDIEDLRVANRLALEIQGKSLDDLSPPSRDLLFQLENMVDKALESLKHESPELVPRRADVSFTRREIREATGWAHARVHRYIKELVELEYILVDSGRNGSRYRYRMSYEGQGKKGEQFVLGLVDPEQLKASKQ